MTHDDSAKGEIGPFKYERAIVNLIPTHVLPLLAELMEHGAHREGLDPEQICASFRYAFHARTEVERRAGGSEKFEAGQPPCKQSNSIG